MDAARWTTIKDIFAAAVERPDAERDSFLENACGGDESLRREVEALLRNSAPDDTFLSVPAFRFEAAPEDAGVAPGNRVGNYEIVKELGSGGMGKVYLAARADDVYRKNVAIKIVRPGMDGGFVISRFRNERQILAAFDHPNIARLLDGGSTADGRPYFVMEYIEGRPIDAFCDERNLSPAERIRLFLDVCSAVQYAHQHLVVHRDLKPGNILVSADGVPKLLDFGIARLLAPGPEAAERTAVSLRLMTPEYGSPEQVRGEPITTATDVYALGVLLYRLLTGTSPYGAEPRPAGELERAICELEPVPPSAAVRHSAPGRRGWRKVLAGDLDNIILMALRKDPARRYPSVEQLAEDLRRHLAHLPVRAHRDSFRYRAVKLVRRNPAASAAGALFVGSLLLGMAATAWQARIAHLERTRAERRFNDVRQLANSFLFEFHDEIQALPGSTHARELLVKRALQYLDSLSRESSGAPALERELASAYQRVGDVQGNPSLANLGDTPGALRSQQRALAIREALYASHPADAEIRRELATSHDRVGDLLWSKGERAGALAEYRASLAMREQLWAENADALNGHFLSMSCNNVGDLLAESQDARGALASYLRGLEIARLAKAAGGSGPRADRDLSVSYNRVGDSLWYAGQMPEALENYRRGLEIRQALAAADPSNFVFQRDVMSNHGYIGDTLARMGRAGEALASHRKALDIARSLAAADRNNAQARRDLAVAHRNIGAVLLEQGNRQAAMPELTQALAMFQALAAADPESAIAARDRAEIRDLLGKAEPTGRGARE